MEVWWVWKGRSGEERQWRKSEEEPVDLAVYVNEIWLVFGVPHQTAMSMALGEGEVITIRYHTKHTIRRQSNLMTATHLHTHPSGLPKHPQPATRLEHSKPRE
jgi:hypothetical protein